MDFRTNLDQCTYVIAGYPNLIEDYVLMLLSVRGVDTLKGNELTYSSI